MVLSLSIRNVLVGCHKAVSYLIDLAGPCILRKRIEQAWVSVRLHFKDDDVSVRFIIFFFPDGVVRELAGYLRILYGLLLIVEHPHLFLFLNSMAFIIFCCNF